jgi:hypothetical protein
MQHKDELTLKDLIGYVESQECGKRSQALLSGAGGLNRVSEYQAAKGKCRGSQPGGGHRLGGRGVAPGRSVVAPQAGTKCTFCGHGDYGSSQAERAGKCPALSVECNKCRKTGHFPRFCTSKGRAVRAAGAAAVPAVVPAVAQTGAVTGEEHGTFFCISGSCEPAQEVMRRQEEEAEVPGQPHQSLASGGVPAWPGTERAEKWLLVAHQDLARTVQYFQDCTKGPVEEVCDYDDSGGPEAWGCDDSGGPAEVVHEDSGGPANLGRDDSGGLEEEVLDTSVGPEGVLDTVGLEDWGREFVGLEGKVCDTIVGPEGALVTLVDPHGEGGLDTVVD